MKAHIGRRSALKALAAPLLLAAPAAMSGCAQRGSTTPAGTLNIGQISNSVAFFPLFIAEQNGFLADAGIKVGDRPRLGTGAKVAAALKSGSIDVGAGVATDAFNLAENEPGTRIVSSLVNEYYVDIVVSQSFSDPGPQAGIAERTRALVGKKIGITGPGSGTEALVTYLFGKIGRDAQADATLVNLGSAATSAVGALESRRVDALAFFQPIGEMAETSGVGRVFISPARGDVPDMAGAMHGVMFSTQLLLNKKAKEIEALRTAIQRALDVIHGDAGKARELLGKYLESSDPAALDRLLPVLRKETAGTTSVRRAAYDTSVRFHLESELIKKDPGYAALIPEEVRG